MPLFMAYSSFWVLNCSSVRSVFSGLALRWARCIVLDDCPIMVVMRFMALLAWIWASESSAMSAAWSIWAAMACLARSMRAFWAAWPVSPFLRSCGGVVG